MKNHVRPDTTMLLTILASGIMKRHSRVPISVLDVGVADKMQCCSGNVTANALVLIVNQVTKDGCLCK